MSDGGLQAQREGDDVFSVRLPTALTGFAPDCVITSASRDWLDVAEGDGGWRTGEAIQVPDRIFEDSRRVRDELAYRIRTDDVLQSDRGDPESGGVVLLLESPHRDEFDGRGGPAIGPLRNRDVRKTLEKHLPSLIRKAELSLKRSLVGKPVILVNAVQYQASLQSLMVDYGGSLRSGVRTPVWRAVFDNGGSQDLLTRLDRYEPALVLLAPTKVVRPAVIRAIRRHDRRWPWLGVNYHPSYWTIRPPRIDGTLQMPR